VTSSRKLTLADIADARAYERTRYRLRADVLVIKQRRRVSLGTVVTLMFENRETMRYQIQEMARAEHTFTDEGIIDELAVYNPLIPEPGHLCATLFIELTSDAQLREWLGKLVGVERSVVFRMPNGDSVRCIVDPQHAAQLTREHVTAAVHYVTFEFTEAQVAAFTDGVILAIDHSEYQEAVELLPSTVVELRADLLP